MRINELFNIFFKQQGHSLKIQSLSSAFWIMIGKGSGYFLKMIGSVVLTRILFPEAFGLMATATLALTMANLFSDTGVKTAIIQNPRGSDSAFLDSAWIISICRGFLLFVILSFLSIPISKFYEEPALKGIILIIAFYPLILGFENPALSLFIKKFKLRERVSFELCIQLLGLTSTIGLTFFYRSVYAMAIGVPLSAFYRALGSYLVVSHSPSFSWNKEAGAELFHFGKYIFMNTMMTWAVYNSDILFIGRFLDMDSLGFYNLGKNLGYIIITFCLLIVAQAYLPAVSSVADNLTRVIKIYRRSVTLFLTIAIPFSMTLSLFSGDIIRFLYDPRYQPAQISMYWISMFGIFRILGSVTGMTFIAIGRPVFETCSMAFGVVNSIVFVLIGIHVGGLSGASIGMAISLLLTALVQSAYLLAKIKFPLIIVIRPWLQSILILGSTFILYLFLRRLFSAEYLFNIPFIIVMGLSSMVVAGIIYFILEGPNPLSDERDMHKGFFYKLLS